MTDRTYLPALDVEAFLDALHARDWTALPALVKDLDNYDRLGLDRLMLIINDMQERLGRLDGLEILDIGCNSGLFSLGLAGLGNRVTGIDNLAINGQARYRELLLPGRAGAQIRLLTLDAAELLAREPAAQWDIVLLLNVVHHWEFGYAQDKKTALSEDRIQELMAEIIGRTRDALYIETPWDEPGIPPGYGWQFLERFVKIPVRLSELGLTVGPGGYLRQFFRITRI